jgi:hypothetical protein
MLSIDMLSDVYAESRIFVVILSVIMFSFVMLKVIALRLAILSVIIANAIMLCHYY